MTQLSKCQGVATTISTDATGALCVTYHNTVVWQRTAEGKIILRTGGWKTATTKLRMNQAFNEFGGYPYCVFQRKGDWFVGVRQPYKSNCIPFDDDTLVLSAHGGISC